MNIVLPEWMELVKPPQYADDESAMRYVLSLARRNIEERTGGPFAAALVSEDHRVIASGVNLVTSLNCSVLHAEIVTIMMASERLGTWALAERGRFTMIITAEPCAMCMGAIPWAGIKRVVTCVRDEDVRAVGFNEGNKPQDWIEHYTSQGISVTRDVLRNEGIKVLEAYVASGAVIYNGE